MEDNISKIKERIDVVDLISEYIKLQKAGSNFKAPCPFHNEKTPSFYVSPERQIWHCFGCNAGGSIFDFVMQMDGVEFGEALKILANKAGIELQHFDASFKNERIELLNICEKSAKFFEKQLWESNSGKRALQYLKDRKVKEDIIKSFRLGYAPALWDSLLVYLRNCGFRSEDIEKAGLIIKKESGEGWYDRFRSRIMFPIFDLNGQVAGFTGRIFEASASEGIEAPAKSVIAKYVNTPQTILYDKSRILYGLDRAKLEIKKKGECVVVEGNMDVIMSHQAGAANCVASSGTALTDHQLSILKRYTQNLNFCFDEDTAGQSATDRGVSLALARGFDLKITALNDLDCKDPADYVKKYGNKWLEKIKAGSPLIDFYVQRAFSQHNPEIVEGKKAIAASLLPLFKSISNNIEKHHWLSELSLRLKVEESALQAEMEKVNPMVSISSQDYFQKPRQFLETAGTDLLEDFAMSLVFKGFEWYKDNYSKISDEYLSPLAQAALSKARSGDFKKPDVNFLNSLGPDERQKAEVWALQSQAQWEDLQEHEVEEEILKMFFYIKKRQISAKLSSLEIKIKEAEKEKDYRKVILLAKQFNDLSQEIQFELGE